MWDYPRPPVIRVEPRLITVRAGEDLIARSERAVKVCETASPPTIYVPPDDVTEGALEAVAGESYCEWKGVAAYWDVVAGERRCERAAWSYPSPKPAFESIRDWLAFYPGRVECLLGDEAVEPQPGEFYGGWITAEITGPFKGIPGSGGW